jgi:hypothetical protein
VQASLVTKKAKAKLSSIEDQLEDDMVQATWGSRLWQIFGSEASPGNSVDSMLHWGYHLLFVISNIS